MHNPLYSILSNEAQNRLDALDKSQAVIEFDPDGVILTANGNFLTLFGYSLPEIKGRHHNMFMKPGSENGGADKDFWTSLRRGIHQTADYRRVARDGREIWVQASYIPLSGKDGKVGKIVKYATDITTQKLQTTDYSGQIEAIRKSQAVIEFNMDGSIITANQNFLDALGYSLDEIKGQHHRLFVDSAHAESPAYKSFWDSLNRGEYQAAEYKRIGKGGREVWIQASYNPILDMNGKPFKIVKYATDVTAQKLQNADYSGQIEAIGKSQAVIEFGMDGSIITANRNFLDALGYSLDEIKGQHHRIFVDPAHAGSPAYQSFWDSLRRGEYQAAEYKRIGKGGREVWIQASYNPILDMNGKPFKIVKYATDVTSAVLSRQKGEEAQKIIRDSLGDIDEAISNANMQSSGVSSASQQTSDNVQVVAAGAEELNASVQEISSALQKSKMATDTAYDRLQDADQATQRLSKAAEDMGGIVELIQNIAGQINLLALNATIESARAGEAGKGFAVVATEVKTLAKQAADATGMISREIDSIQSVSGDVVSVLETIKQSIESLREYASSSASAIEQQSAVAREMSSNMQSAAMAVASINENIVQLAEATQKADQSTKQVREAAHALSA